MATQSRLVGALATTFLFRGEVGNKMDQKMRMKAGVKKGRSRRHHGSGSTEARRFRNSLMTCGSPEFNSFSDMSVDSLMTCWSSPESV